MNLEMLRLPKDYLLISASRHMDECVVHDDGPCTCGLDEVLEDEMHEELGD
jgi:hypothetical protein